MASRPPQALSSRVLLPLAMASILAWVFLYRRAGSPPIAPPPPAPLSSGPIEARAVPAPVDSTPLVFGPPAATVVQAPHYGYALAVFHTRPPAAAALEKLRTALGGAGFRVSAPGVALPEGRSVIIEQLAPTKLDWLEESFDRFGGERPTAQEWEILRKAKRATTCTFHGPGESAVADYRAVLSVLADLERSAPGYLWDEATVEAFTRSAWASRVDGWEGDLPLARDHFVVEGETKEDGVWLSTRGLEKLGIPDLVVARVLKTDNGSMQSLLGAMVQTLVEHPALPETGKLTVDLRALRHQGAKRHYLAGDAAKTIASSVTLTEGGPAPRDPGRRLLELAFPGTVGELHQRQAKLLADLLPSTEQRVLEDEDDPAFQRALAQARAEAIALKPRVAKGLEHGESLHLRLPFEGANGTEDLWIDVQRWEGPRIQGVLYNTPTAIPGLHPGSHVEAQESAIHDYVHHRADGTDVGRLTKPFGKPAPSR